MGFVQVVYRGRSGLTDKHLWGSSSIAYTAGPYFSFVLIISRKFSKEVTMKGNPTPPTPGFSLMELPIEDKSASSPFDLIQIFDFQMVRRSCCNCFFDL